MANASPTNRWSYKHGGAKRGAARDREYVAWQNMKRRCDNPRNKSYADYGGRGIKVCGRWRNSYEAFIADMGRAPTDGHTIDRINVDGDYEPGNCRWATRQEQTENRRVNKTYIFVDGKSLKQIAVEAGISYYTVYSRYKTGRKLT